MSIKIMTAMWDDSPENPVPFFLFFTAGYESLPSEIPVTKLRRKRQKTQRLAADDWLSIWLQEQDILDIPFEFLDDQAWWAAASLLLTDGLNQRWLEKQFAEIRMRFQQPDSISPRTESGWKRFLKSWFRVADDKEQRAKRLEKYHGTTN